MLADEMGLGKTVQVAAYLLARAQAGELRPGNDGPAIVLCPATMLGHWLRELPWAPPCASSCCTGLARGYHDAEGGHGPPHHCSNRGPVLLFLLLLVVVIAQEEGAPRRPPSPAAWATETSCSAGCAAPPVGGGLGAAGRRRLRGGSGAAPRTRTTRTRPRRHPLRLAVGAPPPRDWIAPPIPRPAPPRESFFGDSDEEEEEDFAEGGAAKEQAEEDLEDREDLEDLGDDEDPAARAVVVLATYESMLWDPPAQRAHRAQQQQQQPPPPRWGGGGAWHGTVGAVPFAAAVLDEGQRIRNPDADTTMACKACLRTAHRLVISGTPIQNARWSSGASSTSCSRGGSARSAPSRRSSRCPSARGATPPPRRPWCARRRSSPRPSACSSSRSSAPPQVRCHSRRYGAGGVRQRQRQW